MPALWAEALGQDFLGFDVGVDLAGPGGDKTAVAMATLMRGADGRLRRMADTFYGQIRRELIKHGSCWYRCSWPKTPVAKIPQRRSASMRKRKRIVQQLMSERTMWVLKRTVIFMDEIKRDPSLTQSPDAADAFTFFTDSFKNKPIDPA